MSFRKLLMAGAAVAALVGSGLAAAPAQAAGPWQGFYAGAEVGYGWSTDSNHEKFLGGADGLNYSWHPSGVVGGGFAGYNLQFDRIVTGFEGDFGAADLHGGYSDPAFPGYGGKQSIQWQGSVRPRLGFLVTPQLLLYGTSGIAIAQIKDNLSEGVGFGNINDTEIRFGWTAGGGAEYNVWRNWNVRAEYRYSDYGSPTLASAQSGGFGERISATENAVQLGVSYKFF